MLLYNSNQVPAAMHRENLRTTEQASILYLLKAIIFESRSALLILFIEKFVGTSCVCVCVCFCFLLFHPIYYFRRCSSYSSVNTIQTVVVVPETQFRGHIKRGLFPSSSSGSCLHPNRDNSSAALPPSFSRIAMSR